MKNTHGQKTSDAKTDINLLKNSERLKPSKNEQCETE